MAKKTKKRALYSFRDGSRLDSDKAPVVGHCLEQIQKRTGRRGIKPSEVIDEAKEPSSPLHEFFEWDNTKAAEAYRVEQARHLLAAITVEYEDVNESRPVRLFVNMKPQGEGNEREYIPTVAVLSDASMRAQLIRQALGEADAWRKRYEHLNELANVFAAIENAKGATKTGVAA